MLLFMSGVSAWALDPCPVCGGRITLAQTVRDDLKKPSKNLDLFNRSMCALGPSSGSVYCTRCWFLSRWDEEEWRRSSEFPDTFFRPLCPAIRKFPIAAGVGSYEQVFSGINVTEGVYFWDKKSAEIISRYNDYCKEHELVFEEDRNPSYSGEVFISVTTKPMAVLAEPLPSKRPVELKTVKAEYQRSTESLRTRYINDLLAMRDRAKWKGEGGKLNKDYLARNSVNRELKSMTLPNDSDPKALSKLLIGKWKSKDGFSPKYRRDGVWNWGLEEDATELVRWHIEGNRIVEIYPIVDDTAVTRRLSIILLNKTQFVYVEEGDSLCEVRSEERIAEKKRR